MVWALAALAIIQGAVIVFWLTPLSSWFSASALGANAGAIALTSEPAGLAAIIDDVPRGLTPLTLSLEPGVHTIAVGQEGTMRTKSVNVTAGSEASVHFEFSAAAMAAAPAATPAAAERTGTLNVNTEPAGAQVFVDEVRRGVSPATVTALAAGTHVVTVRDSRRSVTQRVTVAQGAAATVMISMNPRSEFESGSLAIKSPIPVQIRERGELLGTSEASALLLSTGRHNLELINPELNFRAQRTVDIQAGRTASLELTVPNGTLSINAIPWAEVWIDTRPLGETPIANVAVPVGTHELVFRHPELGERRQSIVVRAGAPSRVGVDLRKGQ